VPGCLIAVFSVAAFVFIPVALLVGESWGAPLYLRGPLAFLPLAVLAVVVGRREGRRSRVLFELLAQRFGLEAREHKRRLTGVASGHPVQLRWYHVSHRGMMLRLEVRALTPLDLGISVADTPPTAAPSIPTGDDAFDRRLFVTARDPAGATAWLDARRRELLLRATDSSWLHVSGKPMLSDERLHIYHSWTSNTDLDEVVSWAESGIELGCALYSE
jgi:hypothetical protein